MESVKVLIERAADGTYSAYMEDVMQLPYGYRHPSPKTTAKIQSALHAFGNELASLRLV